MLWVKTQGTWKEAHQVQVRVEGAQRSTQDVWVKKDGTWHSTCQYIVRVTNFVKYHGRLITWGWGATQGTIMEKPDGSRFSMSTYENTYNFNPSFSYNNYISGPTFTGNTYGTLDVGQVLAALNRLREFRWLGGSWLPTSGKAFDISRNYVSAVSLPMPPPSSAALDAHLAQNIGKSVTLYFR